MRDPLPSPAGPVDPPQGRLDGPPVRALARHYPDGHRLPPHRHPRGQLVHAVSGVMELAARERIWLIPPGQALWVPPGVEHRLRARGAVELRSVYFHPAALPAAAPAVPASVRVSPLLSALLDRAAAIAEDPPPGERDRRILDLIGWELDWSAATPWSLPTGHDPRLARLCAAILADPADGRGLAAWGEEVGASARTLARLFRAETGMSFQVWRRQARLLLALPRLAAGEAVTNVALDLGYANPGAFAAMVRRATGH
ncbi:MAG: hypothetical protein RLZZ501_1784, partial [Pseudomonadota bacterium]